MQVYHTETKGVIDSFVIKGDTDYHNLTELDYKWRIVVFKDSNEARKFAISLGVKNSEIVSGFGALTIPCDVFSKRNKYMIHHPNTHGYIIFLDKEINSETIAHECYHAAFCTMIRVVSKITHDYDQQEMIAYLTGQFVKSFNNEHYNRKSRAGLFRSKSHAGSKKRIPGAKKKVSKRRSK